MSKEKKQLTFTCSCGAKHILINEDGTLIHKELESEVGEKRKKKRTNSASTGSILKDFFKGVGDFADDIEVEDYEGDIDEDEGQDSTDD